MFVSESNRFPVTPADIIEMEVEQADLLDIYQGTLEGYGEETVCSGKGNQASEFNRGGGQTN